MVTTTNNIDMKSIIDNTASIKSVTEKTGLYNIQTERIIGLMDDYEIIPMKEKHLYKQIKENTINLYDTLSETFLVQGWEIVKKYKEYPYIEVLRSPLDGKLHLFNYYNFRESTSILEKPFDEVENLYSYLGKLYLVLTINGKKGLYQHDDFQEGKGLITPVEYDSIEYITNFYRADGIVIYTKDKKKFIADHSNPDKLSESFDEIKRDKKNKNLIYCKNGNTLSVYDIEQHNFLFHEDCDEIEYEYSYEEKYTEYYKAYYFTTKKDGKTGLTTTEINKKIYEPKATITTSTLLPKEYDGICRIHNLWRTEVNGKYGLYSKGYIELKPQYDQIEHLSFDNYAFYHDGLCDIVRVKSQRCVPLITDCKILQHIENSRINALIYQKEDKQGLFYMDQNEKNNKVTPAEYDEIEYETSYLFRVTKNQKQGILYLGIICIPTEYDEIRVGGYKGEYDTLFNTDPLYFALKQGTKYKVAKSSLYFNSKKPFEYVSDESFDQVHFLKDIMILYKQQLAYIYNYKGVLVDIVSATSEIICRKKEDSKEYLYRIDGIDYYYKGGHFKPLRIEKNNLYKDFYDTDDTSFEVSSYDKLRLDDFRKMIDGLTEEAAIIELDKNSKNGSSADYPTLVFKKKGKSNEK